jgi:hypothetical protein
MVFRAFRDFKFLTTKTTKNHEKFFTTKNTKIHEKLFMKERYEIQAAVFSPSAERSSNNYGAFAVGAGFQPVL